MDKLTWVLIGAAVAGSIVLGAVVVVLTFYYRPTIEYVGDDASGSWALAWLLAVFVAVAVLVVRAVRRRKTA